MRKQLLASLIIIFFLSLGTVLIILYGRGYRLSFNQGKPDLAKTGILAAKSFPEGASIFINNQLTAATNQNLNLAPGEYMVKIVKEGYFSWEKKLRIQEEVVTPANALLFPTTPRLEGITSNGATDPILDPLHTKLAYKVASSSALKKNGIYILDLAANPVLFLQSPARQIVDDTTDTFSLAHIAWAPDGRELIATIPATLSRAESTYLLDATQMNEAPRNITAVLPTYTATWIKDKTERDTARMAGLKPKLQQIINQNFTILSWAPDDIKILYKAKTSTDLPLVIKPRLIGINNLNESRKIEKDAIYVYDIKEDVNIKIVDELAVSCLDTLLQTCRYPLTWFSDANHLIYVNDKRIDIMEYDGANKTTVYAGPFEEHFVFPWPNGSKLVIVTNLNNSNILPNLYTIGLK